MRIYEDSTTQKAKAEGWGCHARTMMNTEDKSHYQAFFWVLIDLIVELLGLMIKSFDNQTES